MSDQNTTLKEVIENANGSQEKKTENNSSENKPEESTESTKSKSESESKESDEEVESDKEADEEIQTALSLLRGLRDPKQSAGIVKDLALRVGLISDSSKEISKEDEKDLSALLKETLAEDYPDLKDKLEKIFKKIQDDSDKKINTLKEEIANRERVAAEKEFTNELSSFLSKNKIDDKTADLMIKEMQLIPPGPKISLNAYLTKIHNLVTHASAAKQADANRINKINKNREESSVKNLSSDVSDSRITKGSRLPSAKEAIQLAIEELANK